MKAKKKIFFTFLIVIVSISVRGQSSCKLYIDDLKLNDTIKISIKTFINRNQTTERISIYKNESEKCFAVYSSDSIISHTIELTKSKVNAIKMFEIGVRKQKLHSNIPLNIHSLAEYEVRFRKGLIFYFTKDEFYSLIKDISTK